MENKWVEIDIEALEHNLKQILSRLNSGCRLMAVVKADAYGLGAIEVARQLSYNGVDLFGVAFGYEAMELRSHGIEGDILVFTPPALEEMRTLIENGCVVTVGSREDLLNLGEAAQRTNRIGRFHLKVETGLGRFGAYCDEALEIIQMAQDNPLLTFEGVYTHFAAAAGRSSYTLKQFQQFLRLLSEIEQMGIMVPLRHCCNSSAFLKFPFMHLDAVRIGTILWGQHPAGVPHVLHLQDPFRFKARVTAVRELKKGSYVGYYRTYRLQRDTRMAVIPVGFADGLGVEPAPKPSGFWDLVKMLLKTALSYCNSRRVAIKVMINGHQAVIRGKVFMQFCLAEMPKDMTIARGDVVQLPVKRTLASASIPRIYCKGGEPGKVQKSQRLASYT